MTTTTTTIRAAHETAVQEAVVASQMYSNRPTPAGLQASEEAWAVAYTAWCALQAAIAAHETAVREAVKASQMYSNRPTRAGLQASEEAWAVAHTAWCALQA